MNPWEVLGLAPDERDRKVIRSAYSRLLRTHRPDEDPEGFQRLRAAYEFLKGLDAHTLVHIDVIAEHAAPATPDLLREARPREQCDPPGDPPPPSDLRVPTPDEATRHFLEGSWEPLEALLAHLRGAGRVPEIERIADLMYQAGEGGLPHHGGGLVVQVATIVAPLQLDRARALVDRAYASLRVDDRDREQFEEFDVVVAAIGETSMMGNRARTAMAHIIAVGEWDGVITPPTLQLAKMALRVPRNGAFALWIQHFAPGLLRHAVSETAASARPRATESGGGGWRVAILIIFGLSMLGRAAMWITEDYGPHNPGLYHPEGVERVGPNTERLLREIRARRRRSSEPAPAPFRAPAFTVNRRLSPEQLVVEGEQYEQADEHAAAFQCYRHAAEEGYPVGCYHAGRLLAAGLGVPAQFEAAASWFRRGADGGDVKSHVELARMLRGGRGVEQNHGEALRLLRIAEASGSIQAKCELGVHYTRGLGVRINYARAYRYYHVAALKGNADGMFNLALVFEHGRGTNANRTTARYWYQQAHEAGNRGASEALLRLAKEK